MLDTDQTAKLTLWWRHLSQAFSDKSVTPPYYGIEGEIFEKYYFGRWLNQYICNNAHQKPSWLMTHEHDKPIKLLLDGVSNMDDNLNQNKRFYWIHFFPDWENWLTLAMFNFSIILQTPESLFETHVYYATLNFDVNYHFWSKMIILVPESFTRVTILLKYKRETCSGNSCENDLQF